MSDTRSFSQLNTYERCPKRFELERIEKVWQKPAWWLPMGTGVHKAIEVYELSHRQTSEDEMFTVFAEAYWEQGNKLLETTPNQKCWFGSGPYGPEEDRVRRFNLGRDHIRNYRSWAAKNPDQVIWITPSGEPAIELGFEIDLDGVPVRGYLDQAVVSASGAPDQAPMPRDIKTGRQPGNELQLSTYGEAIAELVPESQRPEYGDFFMTRVGKPTVPYKLISRQELVQEYRELDDGIKSGNFPAKPSLDNCGTCPVSSSCKFAKA